jgi:hypothetical protein
LEPHVGELGHALECTVFGRLEVERGSPVVTEVFAVGAGCASRTFRRVKDTGFHLQHVSKGLAYKTDRSYGEVERVSSDDLMRVW